MLGYTSGSYIDIKHGFNYNPKCSMLKRLHDYKKLYKHKKLVYTTIKPFWFISIQELVKLSLEFTLTFYKER